MTKLIPFLAFILITPAVKGQKFKHVDSQVISETIYTPGEDIIDISESPDLLTETILIQSVDSATNAFYSKFPPMVFQPKVFSGYRAVNPTVFSLPPVNYAKSSGVIAANDSSFIVQHPVHTPALFRNAVPEWLNIALRADRINQDISYQYMVNNPLHIEYAYWDLPVPPRLPEEDRSFAAYIKSMELPEIDTSKALLSESEQIRRHWLHFFNIGLQFSQAYISSNWYQGGNDYLALLFDFIWKVDLNTVYHPNLLFQSALQYKLGINSNPKGSLHHYSFSQDQLQYNLKTGFKAFKDWFYSFQLQFNTPVFNTYPADSETLTAAILSPGTLNMGLGMTFNKQNSKKTFNISLSISPISYNLKTCINTRIDPTQFNIQPGHKTLSEVGSNLEANYEWTISDNIRWRSRIFLFSNYEYFLADWENNFDFTINKFLSCQFYIHPRLDTSSDATLSKWGHWMLKEILSFGLSYTFSTKG